MPVSFAVKVDVRESDKSDDWKPRSETFKTLSRSHPKTKDKFEARRKAIEAEAAAAEAAKAKSQRTGADRERVDPKWRTEDPNKFVLKKFAVVRLTHDAIRIGFIDTLGKADKIGKSPIAITMAKTEFEKVAKSFALHRGVEEASGGIFAMADKLLGDKVSEMGFSQLNQGLQEEIDAVMEMFELASRGDHKVAKELKETIAELQLAFETTLQVKEEVIMPVAEKIDVAAALSLLDGKALKFQMTYVVGKVKTHTYGNYKMLIAATKATLTAGGWSAIASDIEKASGKANWEKVQKEGFV